MPAYIFSAQLALPPKFKIVGVFLKLLQKHCSKKMSTLTFNDIQYNLVCWFCECIYIANAGVLQAKGTLTFSQSDVEWKALANAGNEKIPANKLTYFEWLFAAPRGTSNNTKANYFC